MQREQRERPEPAGTPLLCGVASLRPPGGGGPPHDLLWVLGASQECPVPRGVMGNVEAGGVDLLGQTLPLLRIVRMWSRWARAVPRF